MSISPTVSTNEMSTDIMIPTPVITINIGLEMFYRWPIFPVEHVLTIPIIGK